ncbi:MAG: hypothetical protein OER88_02185, partial [Planctomycetota bacterium]|nr:hypothetical protein [Planctomycetota bacterium]
PATRPLQVSVLPDPLLWGRENSGLSLEVAPTVEGLRVSLVGLSDARVPRDLSSGWFVALDDHNRVLAHGSLEGGGPEERTYRDEDLVRASGLEAIVPYPRVPKAATGLLLAVRLDDGRSLHGRTVLSRRIRLSDTMAR